VSDVVLMFVLKHLISPPNTIIQTNNTIS